VEKFSTEIVLQKFRGELTMLDGRGDNAEAGEGGGYNGGFSSGPRAQTSAAPREDFSADLDDEIPF
jgi:single-strand DNA-binding protein